MRYFNTSGPCDPEKHYTVLRELLVAHGTQLAEQGRYFTIFAPRQSGKTTYFQLLLRALGEKNFTPIWISFEGLRTLDYTKFYRALTSLLQQELRALDIQSNFEITDAFQLRQFFELMQQINSPIVLVRDEFEDIPDIVLSEIMHTFRSLYHKKQSHSLHSLILVGVSTLAELILSSASSFNITDDIQVPYFTLAEVSELIGQYVAETGQAFERDVIEAIHENTAGQPGLVNGLCALLVTELATERTALVTMTHFGHYSLDAFINFFVERLGGYTFIEVPSGRGRTDILILYKNWKTIIETKVFTDNYNFQQGKRQLAEYLTSEGIAEGYHVVFSNLHTEEDEGYFAEEIAGKRIHTYILRIRFVQPSRLPAPNPEADPEEKL